MTRKELKQLIREAIEEVASEENPVVVSEATTKWKQLGMDVVLRASKENPGEMEILFDGNVLATLYPSAINYYSNVDESEGTLNTTDFVEAAQRVVAKEGRYIYQDFGGKSFVARNKK